MRRFASLTIVFALLGAGAVLVQFIPGLGTAALFFGGAAWIGVIAHAYVLTVGVLALRGGLPRVLLLVPGLFYGGGIAAALYSDVMASRWIAAQAWLRVDRPAPAEARHVSLDSWSIFSHWPRDAAPRPEQHGFEWAFFSDPPRPDLPRASLRFVPAPEAGTACPRATPRLERIGDRCFRLEPVERPATYVRVGGPPDTGLRKPGPLVTERVVESHSWGTVYRTALPIVLHQGGSQTVIGSIGGASIDRHGYLLFPSFGCGPVGGAQRCSGGLTGLPRRLSAGASGIAAGDTAEAPLLFGQMLARLRGG